ncbi:MAG: hypothetical protein IPP18_18435 [Rhodocyclaceae bacterium]|nr:hypothetical protein [Rhodocyclaceae bacterium]
MLKRKAARQRLLKAGLAAIRQEQARLDAEARWIGRNSAGSTACPGSSRGTCGS